MKVQGGAYWEGSLSQQAPPSLKVIQGVWLLFCSQGDTPGTDPVVSHTQALQENLTGELSLAPGGTGVKGQLLVAQRVQFSSAPLTALPRNT